MAATSSSGDPEVVAARQMQKATGALLENVGFTHTQESSLNLLTDVGIRFMEKLCNEIKLSTEFSGRVQPIVDDLSLAFKSMKFSTVDFHTYLREVGPVTPVPPMPLFPMDTPKRDQINGYRASSEEIKSRPAHIPEYLPAVRPDEHELNGTEEAEVKPDLDSLEIFDKLAATFEVDKKDYLNRYEGEMPSFFGSSAESYGLKKMERELNPPVLLPQPKKDEDKAKDKDKERARSRDQERDRDRSREYEKDREREQERPKSSKDHYKDVQLLNTQASPYKKHKHPNPSRSSSTIPSSSKGITKPYKDTKDHKMFKMNREKEKSKEPSRTSTPTFKDLFDSSPIRASKPQPPPPPSLYSASLPTSRPQSRVDSDSRDATMPKLDRNDEPSLERRPRTPGSSRHSSPSNDPPLFFNPDPFNKKSIPITPAKSSITKSSAAKEEEERLKREKKAKRAAKKAAEEADREAAKEALRVAAREEAKEREAARAAALAEREREKKEKEEKRLAQMKIDALLTEEKRRKMREKAAKIAQDITRDNERKAKQKLEREEARRAEEKRKKEEKEALKRRLLQPPIKPETPPPPVLVRPITPQEVAVESPKEDDSNTIPFVMDQVTVGDGSNGAQPPPPQEAPTTFPLNMSLDDAPPVLAREERTVTPMKLTKNEEVYSSSINNDKDDHHHSKHKKKKNKRSHDEKESDSERRERKKAKKRERKEREERERGGATSVQSNPPSVANCELSPVHDPSKNGLKLTIKLGGGGAPSTPSNNTSLLTTATTTAISTPIVTPPPSVPPVAVPRSAPHSEEKEKSLLRLKIKTPIDPTMNTTMPYMATTIPSDTPPISVSHPVKTRPITKAELKATPAMMPSLFKEETPRKRKKVDRDSEESSSSSSEDEEEKRERERRKERKRKEKERIERERKEREKKEEDEKKKREEEEKKKEEERQRERERENEREREREREAERERLRAEKEKEKKEKERREREREKERKKKSDSSSRGASSSSTVLPSTSATSSSTVKRATPSSLFMSAMAPKPTPPPTVAASSHSNHAQNQADRATAAHRSRQQQNGNNGDSSDDEEIWICPVCSVAYVEGAIMIGCDCCDAWFHWECIGMTEAPAEEIWYCDNCLTPEDPAPLFNPDGSKRECKHKGTHNYVSSSDSDDDNDSGGDRPSISATSDPKRHKRSKKSKDNKDLKKIKKIKKTKESKDFSISRFKMTKPSKSDKYSDKSSKKKHKKSKERD